MDEEVGIVKEKTCECGTDRQTPSLDVVVLTYNRSNLFAQALTSVCNQSYDNFNIKVLNNGSTDDTEEVFNEIKKKYPNRRFEYMAFSENHLDDYFLERKNEFITADYVIVFHDDDIMHPHYIEYAMKVITENPDIVVLGGKTKESENPEILPFDELTGKYIIGNTADMVKWYYRGDTFAFPAIIYRAEFYKSNALPDNHPEYGNRGDIPFLIEVSKNGKVCEMQDRFLHYRYHTANNGKILPTLEQRINLIKTCSQYLLNGSAECEEIFYKKVLHYMRVGFVPFEVAKKQGWTTQKTEKEYKLYMSYPVIVSKMMLYGFLKIFAFGEKRKYLAEKTEKYKKRFIEVVELKKTI